MPEMVKVLQRHAPRETATDPQQRCAVTLSAPEPLSEAHGLSSFSCGKPVLDNWLRTHAPSNQRKGFTAVMVVHEAGRVIGYDVTPEFSAK